MLKDVQGEIDLRQVPLKNVGIKNLRWPISMKDREKGIQSTVATISMAVDLPHDMRGTHMSRFVECLQSFGPVTPFALEHILDALKEKLQAEKAMLELEFTYFIQKEAPQCKFCNSNNTVFNGNYTYKGVIKPRVLCKDCNNNFIIQSAPNNSNIISGEDELLEV